jgi:eukaryotic-like serine/threonine-protein kinase
MHRMLRDIQVGDRLDRYEVLELISRGGMASVFKAADLETGELVALKVPYIQYESDVVFYQRLEREERIGLAVSHPHLVRFLPVADRSRTYLAMELVNGHSLREELRRSGKLPVERALTIARELCEGLAALHAAGAVHRDVKAENVLMSTSDGSVKLLDYGIASLRGARRLTWNGLSGVLGTPDCMAPEQIEGRRGDCRTDVYAVGSLLHEMITGSPPFQADNVGALFHAKLHERARPLSAAGLDLPPGLAAVVASALERSPELRQQSIEELRLELIDPSRASRRREAATPPGKGAGAFASALLRRVRLGLAALARLHEPSARPVAPIGHVNAHFTRPGY